MTENSTDEQVKKQPVSPVQVGGVDWARYERAHQLRKSGMTFKEVGAAIGVGVSRARNMVNYYVRWESGKSQREAAWWYGLKRSTVSLLAMRGAKSRDDCMRIFGVAEAGMTKRIAKPAGKYCYVTSPGNFNKPVELRVLNEVRAWLGLESVSWPQENVKKTIAQEQFLEGARAAVLDALDAYMRKLIDSRDRAAQSVKGANDADLPQLFAGLDAHMLRVAVRINDPESREVGSAYLSIDLDPERV